MEAWRLVDESSQNIVAVAPRCGAAGAGTDGARTRRRQPTSSRPSTPPSRSSGRSRKARTPTTSRRWPRSIRTCSASPSSPPTARSTPPATSRPRSRSSRSRRSSRWRRSSRSRGSTSIEKRIGVDATGARFNSIIAVEAVRTVVGTGAPEMNPLVNPGRDLGDQHGDGRERRRGLEEDHRLPQRRRRAPADRAAGRLQVRVGHQPAQPGDRRADARLRLHQDRTGSRPSISTRASARSASTRETSRRWRRRWRPAARTR